MQLGVSFAGAVAAQQGVSFWGAAVAQHGFVSDGTHLTAHLLPRQMVASLSASQQGLDSDALFEELH
jgi:hypothetical protein